MVGSASSARSQERRRPDSRCDGGSTHDDRGNSFLIMGVHVADDDLVLARSFCDMPWHPSCQILRAEVKVTDQPDLRSYQADLRCQWC